MNLSNEQPAPTSESVQDKPIHGHIRSFVMRRGHLSDAQRDAHERLLPQYGVPPGEGPIDFDALFGRQAPVVLEIGFGMGHTTAAIAAARPETDFLGIEVYTPGVGSLLRHLEDDALTNVRIIQLDAVDVLKQRIAQASLAGVHIYFPDPWPKLRHRALPLAATCTVRPTGSPMRSRCFMSCRPSRCWSIRPMALRLAPSGARSPSSSSAACAWVMVCSI